MVSQFLTQHSVKETPIELPATGPVNPYEDLLLKMWDGWK
jgi:hypothetical protein